MGILKPVPMRKVGLIGLKDDQEQLLSVLHDLGVVQIEPISKEALEYLAPERASDTQRMVGDQLIRFRGLKTALPPVPIHDRRQFTSLAEVIAAAHQVPVDEEVGRLKRAEEEALTRRKSLADTLALLESFSFYPGRLEYLSGAHVLAFFGEAKRELYPSLREAIPSLSDAQFFESENRKSVRFLVAVRREQAEAIGRLAQQRGVTLTVVPPLQGTIPEAIPRLRQDSEANDAAIAALRAQLRSISSSWYPTVAAVEEALTIEARKLDVYAKLGAGSATFALEGWVPQRSRTSLEGAVDRATQGRTYVYDAPIHETAPTQMENPPGFRWYEFFIRFYSLPQSTEFDPTFIFAIFFSIFFGFMVADWGFALVILLICLWMIAGFPGGGKLPNFVKGLPKTIMAPPAMRQLAYALLPGCIVGIALGLTWNVGFGAHFFSWPFYDEEQGVTRLLGTSIVMGLVAVSLGFGLGAVHEYYMGRPRLVVGKVGGIFAALGVFGIFVPLLSNHWIDTGSVYPWVGFLIGGIVLMIVGEGPQGGGIGSLEVLSHVLSYARLAGILLAAFVLADLILRYGVEFIVHPSAVYLPVLGIILIVFGLGFCLVLAVFEPGIQGARLIFVEHLSKYYEGNGRVYAPFGSARTHTLPLPAEKGGPAPAKA